MSRPIVDVHLFEKAYVKGHGDVAPHAVQEALTAFRFGFAYGADAVPIIDAYVTLEAYLNWQQNRSQFDELNTNTHVKVQLVKQKFILDRGWSLVSVCANKVVLVNASKNLRFERKTLNDVVQAAYNFEVIS